MLPTAVASAYEEVDSALTQPSDSTIVEMTESQSVDSIVTDKIYWRDAIKQKKFSIYDTNIRYPKFLNFCVNTYRWGDRVFNSYDTTYVRATGKNWKLMVKNHDWIDSYVGWLTPDRMRLGLSSSVASSVGLQLAFMAVSYAYMFDIDNLLGGDATKHKRQDFSFTCSRFSIDIYYLKNESRTSIHHFGNYNHGKWFTKDFFDLNRECYGVYGYYYFNNKRYSQAAAYCFSKVQLKSAGSFLAGMSFSHQDVSMNFATLPADMQAELPGDERFYRFHYNDYNITAGYAYNWVFRKNWLFNVTAAPSIGYRKSMNSSIEGSKSLLATDLRFKMSLVLNRVRWFYGAQFISDMNWYHSPKHHFINANHDLTLVAGFRF